MIDIECYTCLVSNSRHQCWAVLSLFHSSFRLFKQDKPEPGCCASLCGCFLWCKAPQMITRVKVLRATGLEKQDTMGGKEILQNHVHLFTYLLFVHPHSQETVACHWNCFVIRYEQWVVRAADFCLLVCFRLLPLFKHNSTTCVFRKLLDPVAWMVHMSKCFLLIIV